MRLDAGKEGSEHYLIYDVDNDCRLDFIIWADDTEGEYCSCVIAPDGEEGSVTLIIGPDSKPVTEVKKGNIKIIDMRLPENQELCEKIQPTSEQKPLKFSTKKETA